MIMKTSIPSPSFSAEVPRGYQTEKLKVPYFAKTVIGKIEKIGVWAAKSKPMLRAIAQIHLWELKPEPRAGVSANSSFTHIKVNLVLSMGIGLL